mmetsp:Transcript_22597/g.46946  ORF Transcript_22597/g.46946 Transcript_22597/m.46946 type:complete len:568 (-) Transcript_22597:166-1869(-)|eukprot:CAMPEP_0118657910 /NCGR_PEP_ID=MMETSP0785-20121206/14277_1 /TAXON_ID=91992 /ORGANISM="Bolidomonas pacifica, Strain CCMP 1866" /LENGTH=567 /DNA_ID=CAMNT_0006550873 /DNA_START=308 /DNA_END=2011 /DNA_ORIENTATION=+
MEDSNKGSRLPARNRTYVPKEILECEASLNDSSEEEGYTHWSIKEKSTKPKKAPQKKKVVKPKVLENVGKKGTQACENPLADNPKSMGGRSKPTFWTKEEDDKLREAVKFHNESNWKLIAAKVGTRNHMQCLQRWMKVLTPGLVKGPWTKNEDEMLIRLVNEGHKNWGTLALKIPGRTSKQCRERWFHALDPTINKTAYTEEEDKIIIDLHAKVGNRWATIAKSLSNRTENSVKIRWKAMQRLKKRKEREKEKELERDLLESVGQKKPKRNGKKVSKKGTDQLYASNEHFLGFDASEYTARGDDQYMAGDDYQQEQQQQQEHLQQHQQHQQTLQQQHQQQQQSTQLFNSMPFYTPVYNTYPVIPIFIPQKHIQLQLELKQDYQKIVQMKLQLSNLEDDELKRKNSEENKVDGKVPGDNNSNSVTAAAEKLKKDYDNALFNYLNKRAELEREQCKFYMTQAMAISGGMVATTDGPQNPQHPTAVPALVVPHAMAPQVTSPPPAAPPLAAPLLKSSNLSNAPLATLTATLSASMSADETIAGMASSATISSGSSSTSTSKTTTPRSVVL